MARKPILVVMAAGMGSRYGGLKQIDPVGSQGEAILDYSLYDAHKAGFDTAVIIIKEAIRKDFMETVGERLKKCPMEIRYAYQELDDIPAGYTVPEGRTKPWGTCHAVLCAREAIGDAPFAVINADDYYGTSAYRVIYDALCHAQDKDTYDYYMVGYELGKTVTDHGSVARGICVTDGKGHLTGIDERTRVEKYPGGIHFTEDGEHHRVHEPVGLHSRLPEGAGSPLPGFSGQGAGGEPHQGRILPASGGVPADRGEEGHGHGADFPRQMVRRDLRRRQACGGSRPAPDDRRGQVP